MRARHISYHLIATLLVFGAAHLSYAQEYDDLYFTSKDRKMLKLADDSPLAKSSVSEATIEALNDETYTEDYSAKNVNPEYIARYQSQVVQGESNPAYGTYAETEEVEYYSEEELAESQPPTIVNNYYGSSPYRYQPNRWTFRPSMSFGYNPYWGWNSAFGMSMAFGDPFYNPWNPWNTWNDPFFRPMGSMGFYDPWFDPFYCPPSYGYSYIPRRNAALVGYYNGFYAGGGGRVVVVGDTRPRQYVEGARYGRGGLVTGVSRSVATSTATRSQGIAPTTVTTNNTDRRSVSRGRVSRDYSRTQNEYYNRSRSRVSSSGGSSNGRVASSSTNVRTGTSRSYRSATTQSSYNRGRAASSSSSVQSLGSSTAPSRSSAASINRSNNSRRYSVTGSGTSSSGSRSRSYRSNSSGRSNSIFSSPSRTNTSRSYRSTSPSRSSGSYSSPSRSSSGRSSGGTIRSSGGSSRSYSPSRSSGGSRSSGTRGGGSSRSRGGGRN